MEYRITRLIKNAAEKDIENRTVIKSYQKPEGNYNELVFFVKPEVTLAGFRAAEQVLKISLESFDRYDIRISGCFIIGSRYLEEHGIVEKHYGVINMAAKKGVNALTKPHKEKFAKHFGIGAESAYILGGYEFLETYPEYSVSDLNTLWESGERIKLGAGIYCEIHEIKGKTVYLINGFNPHQIEFFTKPGSYVIVFSLYTDKEWTILRNTMVGVTNPFNAEEGSIRRQILRIKDDIKVEINPGQNGVHLSAGPVEALAEVIRFCSSLPENKLDMADVYTGQKMISMGFTESEIQKYLDNVQVKADGVYQYVFDITEEKNLSDLLFLKSLPGI